MSPDSSRCSGIAKDAGAERLAGEGGGPPPGETDAPLTLEGISDPDQGRVNSAPEPARTRAVGRSLWGASSPAR